MSNELVTTSAISMLCQKLTRARDVLNEIANYLAVPENQMRRHGVDRVDFASAVREYWENQYWFQRTIYPFLLTSILACVYLSHYSGRIHV